MVASTLQLGFMKRIAVGIVLTCSTCVTGASAAQDVTPKTKTMTTQAQKK